MTPGINKGTIVSIIAVVLLAAGGWYAYSAGLLRQSGGPAAAGASDTVATVNGEKITRSALDTAEGQIAAQQGAAATTTEAKAALQSSALDSLIARALLKQAAATAGITASSTEVEAQIATDLQQAGGQDAFDKTLAAQGMTEDSLRTQLSENAMIQAYLEQTLHLSTLAVSDAEIKAEYDKVASAQKGVPPLAQVKDQVKQFLLQQKQQQLISDEVAKLRAAADVQMLI